jgi:hypothetical protein
VNPRRITVLVCCCCLWLVTMDPRVVAAQDRPSGVGGGQSPDGSDADPGFQVPESTGLRLTVDLLAGYGFDASNVMRGFSRQGRIGYAILGVQGKAGNRLSYKFSMNPVDEGDPLPACGVAGFFYPNDPKRLYGEDTAVQCVAKNGNRRVDAYRGIALDVAHQQGALREAYLDVRLTDRLKMRVGRTKLPMGFDWQEAGSFTAKDAPLIQRINAQHNFATMFSYARRREHQRTPFYSGNVAASLGNGNRWWDYNYFYFEDNSLDSNVDLTVHVSGTFAPVKALEVRAAYQKGTTGSKVESKPSYWASKRNDDAVLIGATYQPVEAVRVIVERASYTWGPTTSSAHMLGAGYSGIKKRGFYVTVEGSHHLNAKLTLGGSVSREELDRADSLVRFLAIRDMYEVHTGRKDRLLALRAYLDVGRQLRIGFYNTRAFNPYPWLSGITPVTGSNAFSRANTNKWGIISRFSVL